MRRDATVQRSGRIQGQERLGVCHVRRGDDSSVRLKVCWLFKAGNRYVTKLRYSFAPGPPPRYVEEMSFLLREEERRGRSKAVRNIREIGNRGLRVPVISLLWGDNNRRLPSVP